RIHPLQRVHDGGGLRRPDEDREVPGPALFTQQDDGLIGGHLDPDAHQCHRDHEASVPPGVLATSGRADAERYHDVNASASSSSARRSASSTIGKFRYRSGWCNPTPRTNASSAIVAPTYRGV